MLGHDGQIWSAVQSYETVETLQTILRPVTIRPGKAGGGQEQTLPVPLRVGQILSTFGGLHLNSNPCYRYLPFLYQ
jgi:hypothetical protein